MMQARDATGRRVSLLNDDSYARPLTYRSTSQYTTAGNISPLPHTPELLRSNSYDSSASYEALSPMTPAVYDFSRSPYEDFAAEKPSALKRPSYIDNSRTNSFIDEESSGAAALERSAKRYPCRYRDSHGCEKTFTTSGHASRHSKIHTAEKAVQCTYPGCHKKFTRADNMKQHLETHYKDKSRSSSKSSKSPLGSSKRGSVSSRSSASQGSGHVSEDVAMWDADHYGVAHESAWDMRLNLPLMTRPGAIMRTSSGLDALAAIACQEGSA